MSPVPNHPFSLWLRRFRRGLPPAITIAPFGLCEDQALASSRCQLVSVVRGVLAEGLRLLGLRAPQRM